MSCSPGRRSSTGMLRPPPATSISFTFYRRLDEEDGKSASGEQSATGSSSFAARGFQGDVGASGGSRTPTVCSIFELPDGFTASEANRGLVERSVNKFLRDLLRRADCIDSVAESMSAAEDATAARLEAKPLRKRPTPNALKAKKPAKSKSLLDEASESMSMQWSLTAIPTLEEMIEADQILFSKDLSPQECAAAMNTLRNNLGELRYETWESMPVIISDHFAVGEVSGCVTIPWDFTPIQFVSFLALNDAAVSGCRQSAMRFATEVERLIAELCNALDLDDVLISCSHKEAIHTLRLLHRHRDLLRGFGLTDLTLEIETDRFATRANGVVIVSSGMKTGEALREWMEVVQPKLELQKKLYKVSKHMLETTMWHLKEFREAAQPGGVDAFQNNECTYAQRLEWSRELFRIGASLAQWDWSEFTFILSPELDLDWEHRTMSLPANFDGDAFVRYVEDIQKEAVQRKRGELLEQSAMQRNAEEAARARMHKQELQLTDSDANNAEETSASSSPPDDRRDVYRRANPHMEEYLTSSPDRVDALSVERPLSHSVTFNSDAEAEDQLKWEGFYQEPIVDQVPTGDIDDINHTFMATNRWHREEAAKKLLEELKTTYGPKSRRFDYQKMGDLLEINNAKVQPKGFPTLTRGLKPGSV